MITLKAGDDGKDDRVLNIKLNGAQISLTFNCRNKTRNQSRLALWVAVKSFSSSSE